MLGEVPEVAVASKQLNPQRSKFGSTSALEPQLFRYQPFAVSLAHVDLVSEAAHSHLQNLWLHVEKRGHI